MGIITNNFKGTLRTGTFCKCARCGSEEFFSDKEVLGDSTADVATSKWKLIDIKHICPNCADDYETLMEKFWRGIDREENDG